MRQVRVANPDDYEALRDFDAWNVITPQRIEAGECYACCENDRVLGFGILDRSFCGRRFVAILFVHPDHRATGIGNAILDHFENAVSESQLWISTNIENTHMQRLLHKRDYLQCGVIQNLGRVPELFYMKRLDERLTAAEQETD